MLHSGCVSVAVVILIDSCNWRVLNGWNDRSALWVSAWCGPAIIIIPTHKAENHENHMQVCDDLNSVFTRHGFSPIAKITIFINKCSCQRHEALRITNNA